jgi:hypothetical protein
MPVAFPAMTLEETATTAPGSSSTPAQLWPAETEFLMIA